MSALHRRRNVTQLRFEALEERAVPATFTVTTLSDSVNPNDNQLSLREAIASANADTSGSNAVPHAINFRAGLSGVIQLNLAADQGGGDLRVSRAMSINGPGATTLTVEQTLAGRRVFTVERGPTGSPARNVAIQGITITGGGAQALGGAGVRNEGANVTLRAVEITGNDSGTQNGGGVNSIGGLLTIRDSTIAGNRTTGLGGGVRVAGGAALIVNSTIDSNDALNGGGVHVSLQGRATITNSTITANSASGVSDPAPIQAATTSSSTSQPVTFQSVAGGVFVESPQIVLQTSSTAATDGAAIAADASLAPAADISAQAAAFPQTGNLTLRSTIVAENSGANLSAQLSSNSGNNFIGINPGDPVILIFPPPVETRPVGLGPLQLNAGGTTRTRLPQAGSPVIDRGANPLGLPGDQNGQPRTSGPGTDIGAAEVQVSPTDLAARNAAFIQAVTTLVSQSGARFGIRLVALIDVDNDGFRDIVLSIGRGRGTTLFVLQGITGAVLFTMPTPSR